MNTVVPGKMGYVGAYGGHGHGCHHKDDGMDEELLALMGIGALLAMQLMTSRRRRRREEPSPADQSGSLAWALHRLMDLFWAGPARCT